MYGATLLAIVRNSMSANGSVLNAAQYSRGPWLGMAPSEP
jgi:hypothetical protein